MSNITNILFKEIQAISLLPFCANIISKYIQNFRHILAKQLINAFHL